MNVIAFFIGMGILTAIGWCMLRLLEQKTTLFTFWERLALGCVMGSTAGMFVCFLCIALLGVPLTLVGMGTPLLVVLVALCLLRRHLHLPLFATTTASESVSSPLPRWAAILLGMLVVWSVAKIVITGTTFLLLTPTFLDDSLDNWNLRGKVFYVDHALTLVMPNEDPIASPKGVSSYPPTIPMLKAWLANIAGQWNDPLVNSIHGVWYVCALMLLFGTLKRLSGKVWAWIGVYLLASIPLYLMHGTNAYGDAFLSVHLLAALVLLLRAWMETQPADVLACLRVAACVMALIPFTKNEGMIVYLPPLILLFCFITWRAHKRGILQRKELLYAGAWLAAFIACIVLPWLFYKWSHGLTFGNGKPFTSFAVTWQQGVLLAIGVNTFFEGNWLLLFPLFFGLVLARLRSAWTVFFPLTAFFVVVYFGQMLLYLFTPLSTEAVRQTGYARGLVQFVPVVVLLTTLLLQETWSRLRSSD